MILFYIVPMIMWWILIAMSICDPRAIKYSQIEDTAGAVGAFVVSLIPAVNIVVFLFVLADSKVRFHK